MKRVMPLFLALLIYSSSASAFIPPVIYALVTAAGVVQNMMIGATLASIPVAAYTYLMATDSDTGESVRIPLSESGNSSIPVPAAPDTALPAIAWIGYNNVTYPSYEAACTSFTPDTDIYCHILNSSSSTTGGNAIHTIASMNIYDRCMSYCSGIDTSGNPFTNWMGEKSIQTSNACTPGYTTSGAQCALTDARQALSDNSVDYQRSPSGLAPASTNDADNTARTIPINPSANGGVYATGTTMYGEKTVTSVKPLANGASQVITQISRHTGILETQTLTFGPTGHVEDFSITESAGQLSLDPTTGAATATALTPVMNPDGSLSNLSPQPVAQPVAQPVQFPSDYARVGEAESAQIPTRTKLDTLHTDLTESKPPPADPVIPEQTQFSDSFFKTTFTDLQAWTPPAHDGSCPVWQFDLSAFHLGNHIWDTHCTLGEQIRGQLSTIMIVVWTLIAMFIILGA